MKLFSLGTALLLTVFISAGCMSPAGQQPRIDLWGDPSSPDVATRTIRVDGLRYVNVTGGEIIRFIADDQAFAWNFDSAQDIPPFDLRLIAPPNIDIDHDVTVYVTPNPLYVRHHGPFWSPWPP